MVCFYLNSDFILRILSLHLAIQFFVSTTMIKIKIVIVIKNV